MPHSLLGLKCVPIVILYLRLNVIQISACVPDGVVCFFTSYLYLESVVGAWYDQGVYGPWKLKCKILSEILVYFKRNQEIHKRTHAHARTHLNISVVCLHICYTYWTTEHTHTHVQIQTHTHKYSYKINVVLFLNSPVLCRVSPGVVANLQKHKLLFIETQDSAETSFALINYIKVK